MDRFTINELKKKIVKLTLAYSVCRELTSVRELGRLLELLVDMVTSHLRVEMGSIMLVDKMQKELRIKAARGLEKEIVRRTRVKMGEGISGWVAKEVKPLLIEDITKHPKFKKRDGKYRTDSLLTVPLVAEDEVIGVLNVNNKANGKKFDKEDLDTLITIANQAALLIKNSQTYEEMKRLDTIKSEFVSIVSHELRTPLTAVRESLALLLDKIPGKINKDQEQLLHVAQDNIDRLNRLVTNLLDSSQMESGKMAMKREFVDIVGLIYEVVDSFKASARKKRLTLQSSLADDVKGIWADSDRLAQVLDNLISNAVKYTPERGHIEVRLQRKDKAIEIVIRDTGKGIRQEDKEKIFDKFSQLSFKDGKIVSTGLGLAITKDIIELHRGSIAVDSKVGKGSTFTITLPMDLRSEVGAAKEG
jgi:signal transduction histidine kinase